MKNLNQEELDAKREELIKKLSKRYKIRSFKTTTESIKYTQKMAKAISALDLDLEKMQDQDISKMFDLFDPELIKYVVGTFVNVKEHKKLKPVDYEKEFINDFENLMIVFTMAIEFLSAKANGSGKPQAQKIKENQQVKINSTKRLNN